MFKKMQNRKGFTLIEMMAVIAIVAVLVAIVVPIVGKSQVKARASVDAANLRSMAATVATRYVSTTDADELLSDLEAPDSELVENSNVIFYVVNGNEMLAYYCTSLLFPEHLRGTTYNGRIAQTGVIDSDYDELPPGAVRLCALTSSGDTYDNAKLDEVTELLGTYGGALLDVVEDFFSTNTDGGFLEGILGGLGNTLENGDAAMKIALINSLMEKYGYSQDKALQMVNDGTFSAGLAESVPGLSDSQKEDLADILDTMNSNTAPTYSACTYYGCTSSSDSCGNTTWTHNTSHSSGISHEDYCAKYGLTASKSNGHP